MHVNPIYSGRKGKRCWKGTLKHGHGFLRDRKCVLGIKLDTAPRTPVRERCYVVSKSEREGKVFVSSFFFFSCVCLWLAISYLSVSRS